MNKLGVDDMRTVNFINIFTFTNLFLLTQYSGRYIPLSLEGRYHVIYRIHKTIL